MLLVRCAGSALARVLLLWVASGAVLRCFLASVSGLSDSTPGVFVWSSSAHFDVRSSAPRVQVAIADQNEVRLGARGPGWPDHQKDLREDMRVFGEPVGRGQGQRAGKGDTAESLGNAALYPVAIIPMRPIRRWSAMPSRCQAPPSEGRVPVTGTGTGVLQPQQRRAVPAGPWAERARAAAGSPPDISTSSCWDWTT